MLRQALCRYRIKNSHDSAICEALSHRNVIAIVLKMNVYSPNGNLHTFDLIRNRCDSMNVILSGVKIALSMKIR